MSSKILKLCNFAAHRLISKSQSLRIFYQQLNMAY